MSNAVRIPGQRLGSNVIMGRLNQGRGTGPAQQLSISQLATVIANNGALPLPSAGSGLISSVDTNFTVTGGGELELQTIASGDLLGNATGSTAEPTATTLTALIDEAIGSTEGNILYRDASVWKVLAPGTLNYVLTMGAAIPAWAVAAGGISFTYGGAWSGTAGYSPGNVATYLGSAYLNYVAVAAPGVSNDQWNSSDSYDMTISTTNTTNDTATTQAASNTYVNALSVGKTSGLWYFEFVCTNLLNNGTSLGIGAANWSSGGSAAGIYMVGNALGNVGGSAAGAGSGSFAGLTNGKRGGVAVNFTSNKFWITADVTASPINWNGSTSNSPGAGTGGVSMGTLTGAMFPTWYGQSSAAQVCVIYATSTGASAVIIPAIPAGFSLWAPSNSPNIPPDEDITHWLSQGNAHEPGGRLSLSSGIAVQTADVVNGTNIYYEPYIHAGTGFLGLDNAGLTLALDSNSGHTGYHQSGKILDIFLYNNSGTLQLVTGPAWTNSTTRSSAIDQTTVPGLWSNTASMTIKFDTSSSTETATAGTLMYVGSAYMTGNGECTCQFNPAAAAGGPNAVMGLYNAYNRLPCVCNAQDSTSSWTYSTATWRNMDGSASNRITYLDGLGQNPPSGLLFAVQSPGSGGATLFGIGFNTSGATAPPLYIQNNGGLADSGEPCGLTVPLTHAPPTLGLNFIQAQEQAAAGTITISAAGNTQLLQLNVGY